MYDETKAPHSANDLPPPSSPHSECQPASAETLQQHGMESERIARDIGFERALTEWIMKHRTNWCRNREPEAS
jgi:hypothetical protein